MGEVAQQNPLRIERLRCQFSDPPADTPKDGHRKGGVHVGTKKMLTSAAVEDQLKISTLNLSKSVETGLASCSPDRSQEESQAATKDLSDNSISFADGQDGRHFYSDQVVTTPSRQQGAIQPQGCSVS